MPIASDVTTGDKPIKPSKLGAGSGAPSYGGQTRPPTAWDALEASPLGITQHENPISVQYGPDRGEQLDMLLAAQAAGKRAAPKSNVPEWGTSLNQLGDELGMRAGALTTVPSIDKPEAAVKAKPKMASDTETYIRNATRTIDDLRGPEAAQSEDYRMKSLEASALGLDDATASKMSGTAPITSESLQDKMDLSGELRAEAFAADAEGRERRSRRAAMNLGAKRERTESITSDEYAKFTPKQKAAVDLNTMLVEAVSTDLGRKGVGGKDLEADDQAAFERVFGRAPAENAPFAPTTVNLLDTIGADLEGFNLKQVVKLKGGFTRDDLMRLGDKPREGEGPDASLTTPQTVRNDLQDALAGTLMATRRDPASAAGLLQTQQALTGSDTMPGAGKPGVLNPDGSITGTMEEQRNFQFQRALNALINPELKSQRETIMSDMREMTGEEWPLFLDFVGTRLRETKQYGNDLDGNPATEQLKPGGLIKRLGL